MPKNGTQFVRLAATMPARKRTKEVAEHFSVSLMTLYRWRKQHDFPQPLKRGRVVLYDIAAIDAWLEAGKELN